MGIGFTPAYRRHTFNRLAECADIHARQARGLVEVNEQFAVIVFTFLAVGVIWSAAELAWLFK